MALTRRDVAKGTVPVLMVVPLGKLLNPVLSLGQGSEPLGGEARPVLERLEGRLGEGVVVTHPWTAVRRGDAQVVRSEEHTSELQSRPHLVCRLLLEKKKIR